MERRILVVKKNRPKKIKFVSNIVENTLNHLTKFKIKLIQLFFGCLQKCLVILYFNYFKKVAEKLLFLRLHKIIIYYNS